MEWLQTFGLNQKQRQLYVYLLESGSHTASQLAKELGEQRTNIYLLTDSLIQLGLIEKDESSSVAEFKVTNPEQLQVLMAAKQRKLASSSAQMKQAMPDLMGLYHLNTAYDGMAYFEGLKGYDAALEDMSKNTKEVCVFGATKLEDVRPDAWNILLSKLEKRALRKINTRIIFETAIKNSSTLSVNRSVRLQKYMQARFWGCSPFEGEVAIYDTTVVLTSYDEKLISLVIKNKAIAATFQAIFNTAWNSSKEVD